MIRAALLASIAVLTANAAHYSERLMSKCLLARHVAYGYVYGHGHGDLPHTVTGEIDLNSPVQPTLPVQIGDGTIFFEKTALAARQDARKLLALESPFFSPSTGAFANGTEKVTGNVVIIWSPYRHDPRLGDRILATCLAKSRS